MTVADEITSLNIYSSQKKLDQYIEKFELFFTNEYEFNKDISIHLGNTLMTFDTEEYKNKRLMLSDKLNKKMQQSLIEYDGKLLHNLIFVYTEAQQWEKVSEILTTLAENGLTKPDIKTIRYLKNNLIYCFQNSTRLEMQEAIEKFDQKFFKGQSARLQARRDAMKQEDETITAEDVTELKQSEKKLLRREARKQKD